MIGDPRRDLRVVLLLGLAVLCHCSKAVPTDPKAAPEEAAAEVVIHAGAPFLMCADSIALTATTSCAGNPVGGEPVRFYKWTADSGVILGRGSSAIYVAPDSVVVATVEVTLEPEGERPRAGFLRLPVQRQVIMLKADDFAYDPSDPEGLPAGWRLFFGYLEAQGLKASVGAVGERMAGGSEAYFRKIADLAASGRIEFFNHGWDHRLNYPGPDGRTWCEFQGPSYEEQRAHLLQTQKLLRERAGLVLRGFGAPGNAFDAATRQAVDDSEDLRYWFFGAPPSAKVVLGHAADMEKTPANPDLATFLGSYRPDAQFIVYQIHPWFWEEGKLAVFAQCIDDLKQAGAAFVLPSEYCAVLRGTHPARRNTARANSAPVPSGGARNRF